MSNYLAIDTLLAEEAEAYITAYSTKYVDAPIGKASTYLDEYIYRPSEGVESRVRTVRFPIPLTAVELQEYKGRTRFAKGSTRYIEVKKKPFNAAESEFYKMIVDPAWTGFNRSPERLRKLAASFPSKRGCLLLNTGETLSSWKGTTWLSTSVPTNPFSKKITSTYRTWWQGFALNHANVEMLITDMADRRDLEDDPLDFGENLVLFASSALYTTAKTVALDPFVNDTQISNPLLKWNLKCVRFPHLAPKRWGLINADAVSDYPLFHALIGDEEFYTYGQDSALFEQHKHMGYELMYDFGIAQARNEALSVVEVP